MFTRRLVYVSRRNLSGSRRRDGTTKSDRERKTWNVGTRKKISPRSFVRSANEKIIILRYGGVLYPREKYYLSDRGESLYPGGIVPKYSAIYSRRGICSMLGIFIRRNSQAQVICFFSDATLLYVYSMRAYLFLWLWKILLPECKYFTILHIVFRIKHFCKPMSIDLDIYIFSNMSAPWY